LFVKKACETWREATGTLPRQLLIELEACYFEGDVSLCSKVVQIIDSLSKVKNG